MRRLSVIAAAFVLFLSSCSKDRESKVTTTAVATTTTTSIDQGLISEVESANDLFVQKLSFRLLNSAEKVMLWQKQLSYYANTNLNPAQKTQLLLLADYISKSPRIFDAGNDHSKLEQFSNSWLATAKTLFPETLLNNIVSKIHTEQSCKSLVDSFNNLPIRNSHALTTTSVTNTDKPEVDNTCSCSTESDYCDTYTQCGNGICVYTVGGGCGFLLTYNCDGKCTGGA